MDLEESRINWKVVLIFLPAAFFTYLFHESGHWMVGEILGNKMVLNLNNSNALSGHYSGNTDYWYISMGGPAFSILQAFLFLILIEITKSIYAYPFVFFATFSRFFSILFGGFELQDEARISALPGIGAYWAALVVLLVLSGILWRGSILLKLNMKAIGYYTTLSTLNILLVISVDQWILE